VVATRLCALGAVAGIKPRPRAGNNFVHLGLESPSLAAALLPRLDVFLCSPAQALPPLDHTPPPPGRWSSCYSPAALPVCHPLSAIPCSAYLPSSVRHPLLAALSAHHPLLLLLHPPLLLARCLSPSYSSLPTCRQAR
jgi:hypothetical protein